MLDAIKREISATLTRMHRADFSKAQGAASGVMGSGTSVYMNDLSERFWFIREQLFVRYAVGDLKRAW